MAFERRSYGGAAVGTTLAADITSGSLSITIADDTGWPLGGAAGPFHIAIGTIDPSSQQFVSNQEKIEVASRTGTTLTIASAGKRGVDGTSAASHTTGETVRHIFPAQDADEANAHVTDDTRDDHSQYHNPARHAAVAHTQAMLGADSVGASQIQANAVGATELANDAVDTAAIANLAVTAAKIANDTITAAQLAADAVGSSEIAANAVGASELADNAVDTNAIVNLAVTSGKLAADSVIAGKIADGAVDATATIVNGIVTLAKLASEDPTDYSATITWTNPTGNFVPGTGATETAHYFAIGKLRLMFAHFTLGTSGNITAGGQIELSLPQANNANFRGFCAARARDSSTGVPWSGTGVIAASATNAVNFATAGSANVWDATNPFNWEDGDSLDVVLVWVTA